MRVVAVLALCGLPLIAIAIMVETSVKHSAWWLEQRGKR